MSRLAPPQPASASERMRAAGSWQRLPWWGRALAIYAASRVVTTALFLWVGAQGTVESRAGADPSLLEQLTAWDGQWYWLVSVDGYPADLPTEDGAVATNTWAFLPLYPWLVKLLSFGVVELWPPVGVLVSVAFGAGAAVLLHRLLAPHIGEGRATFAVAVFAFSPLSFVLQMTYAESMSLCLLFAALCLVDRHRYLAAVPVALVLAYTRPGVLALGLALGLHLLLRLVAARRGGEPVPPRQTASAVLLGAVIVAAGFSWIGIAALVTGVPDAYFETELAWRALWMGRTEVVLFEPWFFAGRFWFGQVLGPVVVVVLVLAFAVVLLLPPVRRLGTLNRLYLASYALYLLAVFFPQSSVFRLLMPMAPLAGALTPRPVALRAAVLAGCVALQALWLWVVLGPFQTYWSVL